MEDCEIVAMYWARNPDAIAATQEKYGIFCYQLAWRVLSQGEDAQECVNDTYLAAWNAMPPHRPQVLSMFLAKLLRRIAINRLKHNLTQKQGGGAVHRVVGAGAVFYVLHEQICGLHGNPSFVPPHYTIFRPKRKG